MAPLEGRLLAALDGSCSALLVVDGSGVSIAPLDARDPIPVPDHEVAALLAAAPEVVVAEAPTWASGDARAAVPAPVVLRIQDGAVLAWSDRDRSYVALSRAELAVLFAALPPKGLEALASDAGLERTDTAAALESLRSLAVLDLEVTEPEPEPEPEPVAVEAEPEPEPEIETPIEAETPAVAVPAPGLPSIWADLPAGSEAVRVLAFRAVGRARRRITGRRTGVLHAGTPAPVVVPEAEAEVEPVAEVVEAVEPEVVAPVVEQPVEEPGEEPAAALIDEIDRLEDDETGAVVADDVDHRTLAERWREADHRVPVFGVYSSPESNANLGLGLIIAYCRVHAGGVLNTHFDLRKASIDPQPMLEEIERRQRPAVVLFSSYMWSAQQNLEISAAIKAMSPNSITVHGGPHAPKYEGDAARYFAEHPHVDVIVRGEGELTVAALLEALGTDADPAHLAERLAEVEGITFRDGTPDDYQLVRTADRARATDMTIFPSPYLTGEFDEIDPERWRSATVESNRGCPYGCTYCDWGSATLSRIRQFPLDRVKAELEWLAARGISEIFLADANFGVFARDVEIAQHIADLKRRYGAPVGVICSFAKNTTKHTTQIVRIWVEAGMCAEGSVALQTTDPLTLRNVKRSNIRIERYDDLAEEFRRLGLPIVTDLLMGLPGSTVESFKTDLQRCIDREVTPRMMETVVLPNSPMNDPEYREQYAIETDAANVIVATSSFTRDDFDEMLRLRLLFRSLEHYGLLRHLFRWLQHEHGIRAVDLIHDIDRAITEEPERYPLLTWVGRYFDLMTVPPGGWPPFYDEVVALLAARHGIVDDPAMPTIVAVQEFLMPTRQRQFPDAISLDHDYVAWYRDTLDTAPGGLLPRLVDYGPGELIVDDPAGVCDGRLLRNHFSIRRLEACDNPFWVLNDWELQSDLMRPMATAIPVLMG